MITPTEPMASSLFGAFSTAAIPLSMIFGPVDRQLCGGEADEEEDGLGLVRSALPVASDEGDFAFEVQHLINTLWSSPRPGDAEPVAAFRPFRLRFRLRLRRVALSSEQQQRLRLRLYYHAEGDIRKPFAQFHAYEEKTGVDSATAAQVDTECNKVFLDLGDIEPCTHCTDAQLANDDTITSCTCTRELLARLDPHLRPCRAHRERWHLTFAVVNAHDKVLHESTVLLRLLTGEGARRARRRLDAF